MALNQISLASVVAESTSEFNQIVQQSAQTAEQMRRKAQSIAEEESAPQGPIKLKNYNDVLGTQVGDYAQSQKIGFLKFIQAGLGLGAGGTGGPTK